MHPLSLGQKILLFLSFPFLVFLIFMVGATSYQKLNSEIKDPAITSVILLAAFYVILHGSIIVIRHLAGICARAKLSARQRKSLRIAVFTTIVAVPPLVFAIDFMIWAMPDRPPDNRVICAEWKDGSSRAYVYAKDKESCRKRQADIDAIKGPVKGDAPIVNE